MQPWQHKKSSTKKVILKNTKEKKKWWFKNKRTQKKTNRSKIENLFGGGCQIANKLKPNTNK